MPDDAELLLLDAEVDVRKGDRKRAATTVAALVAKRPDDSALMLRLAELKRYVERGDYEKILRGEYSHRSDLDTVRLYDEWAAGAESYKARMSESDDPLVNFVRDLGSSVGDVGASVWGQVKGAFSKKKGDDADG